MNRDGQFGFMPVYSDAGINESITGLKAGDKFTLRVDGVAMTARPLPGPPTVTGSKLAA